MDYTLPNISDLKMMDEINKRNTYRRYFADLRLYRLHFHISLLKFFMEPNENHRQNVKANLQNNIIFLDKVEQWIEELQKIDNLELFRKTCDDEIKAVEKIIQSYEDRIKANR